MSLSRYLHGRGKKTIADMAAHFGVTERTVYRDLRSLKELGMAVQAGKSGYALLTRYHIPPLMFTEEEAAALLLGTRFIKLCSDAHMQEIAEQVQEKVWEVLAEDTRTYIDELNEKTAFDPYWLYKTPAHTYWADISKAIADRHPIWIEYYVRSRSELTERTVHPLGLVYYDDHWNLIAYDPKREDMRQFLLDFIQKLSVRGMRTFTPPEGFDMQEYLTARGEWEDGVEIRLRFPKVMYQAARRAIPARILEEEETEDAMTVTFRFGYLPYLAGYLLRFGAKVEVVAPTELRELLRAAALEVANTYA